MSLIVYFIIISVIPLYISFNLKHTYNKHEQIGISSNLSGHEVARKILDEKGLHHVGVESTGGFLSDHYDPSSKTVRLSESNYWGNSVAGASVAAHEVGHAVQDAESYGFLRLRHSLVPVANIGSNLSFVFILIGAILHASGLMVLGVVFFSLSVLFQVVTLPVEFNASSRAEKHLVEYGIIQEDETIHVKKVLRAAAMTYVASTVIAILELGRFILQLAGMTNDED